MIPIKLMLRNFLSYGDEPETLDFAGLDLFCLVGENGHGKSALLDAMTWALWGTSRATTQDELFHAGSIEMTVTFDYALSGQHYQVMRSRRLMRRTANTLLEFRVERDGEMMPLTGGTVDETEALITKSLGMSYRTFINSAFLLQGRADEFTKKTPSERKQILADVLNMHEFETLERDARNQRREQELLVANLRQHAGTLERQVARAQDVEAEATGAAQALRDADAAVVAAVAADQALRAQREAVRAKEQRLVEVEQDLRDVKTERSARELEKRGYDEQIRQTEHLLAHEHELREGYQRWRLTRQVLDSERAKLERLRPLRDRETVLRMSIERHIDSLQCAAQDLQREQAQQREVVARGTRATTELEGLRRERQELTLREQDCLKTEADATRCATLTATLGATLTTDKKRLAELRDHYRLLLGADAACPVCHTALDSARRQSVYQEMKKQGDELNRKIDEDSRALATTTEQKGIFERAMVLHKEALARIPALERKAGTLEEQVNAGDVAKTRLTVVEHDLQHIDQTLKSGAFLPEEQAELARLPREIAAVGYDQGTHDRLTTEFKELEQFEHALQELEEQRLMRQGALAALERIIMECRRLETRARQLADEVASLHEALATVQALDTDLAALAARVRELQEIQRGAATRNGVAQVSLQQLQAAQAEFAEVGQNLRNGVDRLSLLDDLVTAFGKNGVQAMIIEEAIPSIQDEANRILERMTESQVTVSLETQRLNQAGAVNETLDIQIADQTSTRRYEMFSGGEAFRVNFALRIAISRLLARRAGARLQTLVIDEGFGSQDGKGRERLVEALNSIRDDFSTIVVMTHMDDLKDSFPQRVDIVKDARGSHIRVSTA